MKKIHILIPWAFHTHTHTHTHTHDHVCAYCIKEAQVCIFVHSKQTCSCSLTSVSCTSSLTPLPLFPPPSIFQHYKVFVNPVLHRVQLFDLDLALWFSSSKMILISNDTAHCWENETSAAASPFECPCEFIKSTSFPPVPTRVRAAAPVWKKYSRTKVPPCRTERRINIFVQFHSLWKRGLRNIYFDKEDHFLFRGISTGMAHGAEGRRKAVPLLTTIIRNLASHFQAHGVGLIPASGHDVRPKTDIVAVLLQINAPLKWVFTTECTETDGRRRKSDKRVDGNSTLSPRPPPPLPDVQPT